MLFISGILPQKNLIRSSIPCGEIKLLHQMETEEPVLSTGAIFSTALSTVQRTDSSTRSVEESVLSSKYVVSAHVCLKLLLFDESKNEKIPHAVLW